MPLAQAAAATAAARPTTHPRRRGVSSSCSSPPRCSSSVARPNSPAKRAPCVGVLPPSATINRLQNVFSSSTVHLTKATTNRAMAVSAGGDSPLYLGIDMGTSGGRAMVIDDAGTVVASAKKAYPPLPPGTTAASTRDWAETWASALDDLLESLSNESGDVLGRVASAAVAGTSASMLLVDAGSEEEGEDDKSNNVGTPLAPVRLYCDAASPEAVATAAALAPKGHQATAPTSALSKLLDWWVKGELKEAEKASRPAFVVSAADWLTARLGRVGPKKDGTSTRPASVDGQYLRSRLLVTDDNNQLKAGWDPEAREYEPWLREHPSAKHLAPRVVRPGDKTGCVVVGGGGEDETESTSTTYLPAGCLLAGGTTDSIAATLAAGVRFSSPGDAVTSLGSSLAIKLVSGVRIDDAGRGLYSHAIPGEGSDEIVWLVGGSSNAGCAVLRSEFGPDDAVLERLTDEIEKEGDFLRNSTGLDYYPLPRPGERFPVCDPEKQPVLGPRPSSDALHLRAILEGITKIEADGYAALRELGAPAPKRVLTAGGGAKNRVWTAMRARALHPAEVKAGSDGGGEEEEEEVSREGGGEAAYGAALLARRAVKGKW